MNSPQQQQQQQQVFQNQTLIRTSTTQGINNSGVLRNSSIPSPQVQRQVTAGQVSIDTQNEIKSNKGLSFFLLCVSIALTIFFYMITKDFSNIDDCKRLYVASEVNEYVWYFNIYLQFYYLSLVIGANHWKCYNFQLDLPSIYKFFNGIILICILGSTIALQICLNYQDSCGNLTDQIRGYLAVGYIILVILIVYIAFSGRKSSNSSGAIQQPQQQQQQQQYAISAAENQRLADQSQINYSTFNNNNL